MKTVFYFLIILVFCCKLHAQIITTIAGGGYGVNTGDGGPATAAGLFLIGGVAVDANGNIYLSTSDVGIRNFSVVKKVNTAGIITTFAGTDTVGFSGDGGPATAARFNPAGCITFDKKGNVYIADLQHPNERVRKVDPAGIITTFAGNGSSLIPSGDGGPATAASLGTGVGICSDTSGNIYIAAGNRIRKVDTAGIITTFAGTTGGYSGDGGPATAAKMDAQAQIAIDNYGNMYIADYNNNRIRKINTAGIITTIAGNGIQGYNGDGGPATAAEFYSPSGVFPDDCGNVYICDAGNHRVRMVNGSGMIKTIAGNGLGTPGYGGGTYSGDGGQATAAGLRDPSLIYLDKNGNIYIDDNENFRIRYIKMDSCRNTTTSPSLSKGEEVLRIFPNPNSGTFNLNISSQTNDLVNVVVTNIMGAEVTAFTTSTNKETEINLHVAKGLYFVNASTVSGRWVKKVVVE